MVSIMTPLSHATEFVPNFRIETRLNWQDPWGGTMPQYSDGTYITVGITGGAGPSAWSGLDDFFGSSGIRIDVGAGTRTQARSMACVRPTFVPPSSNLVSASEFGFNQRAVNQAIIPCSDISGQDRSGYGTRTASPWLTPFTSAVATRAAFTNFSNASFERVNFDHSLFTEANLTGARFWGSHLMHVDLNKANGAGADFSYSRLATANAEQATADGFTWATSASLESARFDHAFLAVKFIDSNLRSASFRHTNRNFVASDLSSAISFLSASKSDLTNANFESSRLGLVRFSDTKLDGAVFDHASFGSTYFHKASIQAASFQATDLRNASFSESRIQSDFSNADLRNTKIMKSDFRGSRFSSAPGIFACGSIRESDLRDTGIEASQLKCAAVEKDYWDGYRRVVISRSTFDANIGSRFSNRDIANQSNLDFIVFFRALVPMGNGLWRTDSYDNFNNIPLSAKQECRAICGDDHPVWGVNNATVVQRSAVFTR